MRAGKLQLGRTFALSHTSVKLQPSKYAAQCLISCTRRVASRASRRMSTDAPESETVALVRSSVRARVADWCLAVPAQKTRDYFWISNPLSRRVLSFSIRIAPVETALQALLSIFSVTPARGPVLPHQQLKVDVAYDAALPLPGAVLEACGALLRSGARSFALELVVVDNECPSALETVDVEIAAEFIAAVVAMNESASRPHIGSSSSLPNLPMPVPLRAASISATEDRVDTPRQPSPLLPPEPSDVPRMASPSGTPALPTIGVRGCTGDGPSLYFINLGHKVPCSRAPVCSGRAADAGSCRSCAPAWSGGSFTWRTTRARPLTTRCAWCSSTTTASPWGRRRG
jgi:hypothetical protein